MQRLLATFPGLGPSPLRIDTKNASFRIQPVMEDTHKTCIHMNDVQEDIEHLVM